MCPSCPRAPSGRTCARTCRDPPTPPPPPPPPSPPTRVPRHSHNHPRPAVTTTHAQLACHARPRARDARLHVRAPRELARGRPDVDYEVHTRDVQPACGDVRGDQHAHAARAEGSERRLALRRGSASNAHRDRARARTNAPDAAQCRRAKPVPQGRMAAVTARTLTAAPPRARLALERDVWVHGQLVRLLLRLREHDRPPLRATAAVPANAREPHRLHLPAPAPRAHIRITSPSVALRICHGHLQARRRRAHAARPSRAQRGRARTGSRGASHPATPAPAGPIRGPR